MARMPTPRHHRTPYAVVRWSGSDAAAGVASYDLGYRRAPWYAGFGPFIMWKSATTATSAVGGAAGNSYCFAVRARDRAGNTSPWSVERCTAVPLDDRALAASGPWTRATSSAHYAGTYSRSATNGAVLVRTGVYARRLALVATTCATCGTVRVYWNGALLREVRLYSATTMRRRVFDITAFAAVQSGRVTVRVVTAGRPVEIDGLGVSAR